MAHEARYTGPGSSWSQVTLTSVQRMENDAASNRVYYTNTDADTMEHIADLTGLCECIHQRTAS
jgi:hypothetical protein